MGEWRRRIMESKVDKELKMAASIIDNDTRTPTGVLTLSSEAKDAPGNRETAASVCLYFCLK